MLSLCGTWNIALMWRATGVLSIDLILFFVFVGLGCGFRMYVLTACIICLCTVFSLDCLFPVELIAALRLTRLVAVINNKCRFIHVKMGWSCRIVEVCLWVRTVVLTSNCWVERICRCLQRMLDLLLVLLAHVVLDVLLVLTVAAVLIGLARGLLLHHHQVADGWAWRLVVVDSSLDFLHFLVFSKKLLFEVVVLLLLLYLSFPWWHYHVAWINVRAVVVRNYIVSCSLKMSLISYYADLAHLLLLQLLDLLLNGYLVLLTLLNGSVVLVLGDDASTGLVVWLSGGTAYIFRAIEVLSNGDVLLRRSMGKVRSWVSISHVSSWVDGFVWRMHSELVLTWSVAMSRLG